MSGMLKEEQGGQCGWSPDIESKTWRSGWVSFHLTIGHSGTSFISTACYICLQKHFIELYWLSVPIFHPAHGKKDKDLRYT